MTIQHTFADGKYTLINDNGKLTALRHGEPWGRDLTGDNLIYWMLVEVERLKAALQANDEPAPVAKNEEGRITWMIDDWPQNCLLYTHPPKQEAKDEPVAEVTSETGAEITMSWWHEPALPVGAKLYTAPPKRKPLTEDDITNLDKWLEQAPYWRVLKLVRVIEQAHGIT